MIRALFSAALPTAFVAFLSMSASAAGTAQVSVAVDFAKRGGVDDNVGSNVGSLTYHVFDMYQPFMGATPYTANATGPEYRFGDMNFPMVDVSVARGSDGKPYLSLTNTDPHNAAHVVTNIPGKGRGSIRTGSDMDAHNTLQH